MTRASHESPAFKGNQATNIFHPGSLKPNSVYFWRVDAVSDDAKIPGAVWHFRTSKVSVRPAPVPSLR